MKVLVTGGGTAGHINPAIAIAQKIQEENPDAEIIYGGTPNGMESELAPRAGFRYVAIEVKGFRRKLSFDTLKTVSILFKGLAQAWKVLKRENPSIIIGTGGYVCGPLVFLASVQGRKTMIHEQNVIPGATNKILSRFVDSVCVSYEESKEYFPKAKRIVVTGNPVRTEFTSLNKDSCRKQLGILPEVFLVVSTGGSGGAGALNKAIQEVFQKIKQENIYWIHITGKNYYESFIENMESQSQTDRFKVLPFSHEMSILLGAADLSVSRAGALTLAELATAGVPGILIPSPNVANRHQDFNAKVCEDAGMAKIIWEKDLNGDVLLAEVKSLMNDFEKLNQMSQKAKTLSMDKAAMHIYEEVLAIKG